MHSTTGKRPIEIFFGRRISSDPKLLEKDRQEIREKLQNKQKQDLSYHNKDRKTPKMFSEGDTIYVKINMRIGSKLSARYSYKKEILAENFNTTIKTKSGRIIHKKDIRQS